MTIGILCATKDEIAPFLLQEGLKEIDNLLFNIYKLSINDTEIIICESGIGKINATLATTILIQEYHCQSIFFSGVGGSVQGNLHRGDLSIADNITQHDMDITAFGYSHGETPANTYIKTNNILHKDVVLFADRHNISFKQLNYTTGDQFIHSKTKKKWIRETFNADLIDMESYAIGLVCNKLSIPFVIIRSISDQADDLADQDFTENVALALIKSARFILAYLKEKK